MTNLQNLQAQKAELEKALNEVNEAIQAELTKAEQAIEQPKKIKKSDIFFKVGSTYPVFMRTTGIRKFQVTAIDLKGEFVTGSYNGGAEKKYKATVVFEDGRPSYFSIVADNRTKTACLSNHTI